jgi:hypothetical protein
VTTKSKAKNEEDLSEGEICENFSKHRVLIEDDFRSNQVNFKIESGKFKKPSHLINRYNTVEKKI